MLLHRLLLVAALSFASSSLAMAQATSALEQAEEAAGEGDFERAIQLLTAFTREPGSRTVDVARAYSLLGVVQATLGDDAASARAFEWALALDPALPTPPELGPTQRDALERLRASRQGRELAVTIDAPTDAPVEDGVVLTAEAEGAPTGVVLDVTLLAWPDDDEAQALAVEGRGNATLRIPSGAWPSAREIHVRAEASAEGGSRLAERETVVRRRSAGGSGSVLEEPWLWVVVGIVVVGGVTAAVVATQLPQTITLGPPELIP